MPSSLRPWLVAGGVAALALSVGAVLLLDPADPASTDAAPAGTSATAGPEPVSLSADLDVLSAPRTTWTLRPAEILPDAEFVHTSVEADTQPTPTTIGDVLVVAAGRYSQGTPSQRLAGIDSSTGQILWTDDFSGFPLCVDAAGALGCVLRREVGSTLELRDPTTGNVLKEISVPDHGSVIGSDGEGLYLAQWTGTAPRAVRYALPDLRQTWEQTYPAVDSEPTHGSRLEVIDGTVRFTFTDETRLVDAATGRLIATSSEGPLDPSGYRLTMTENPARTTVQDFNGSTVLARPGQGWFWNSPPGRLGIARTLYDLATGTAIWTRDDLPARSWRWSTDGRNVTADLGDDRFVVLDGQSGATLWEGRGYGAVTWADRAYLAAAREELTVRDRQTGSIQWRRDLLGGPDELYVVSVAAGTVSVISRVALQGFTGFAGRL